jgi:MinD-like ATPase involved in chromosome partitioning or flagellar assembly
MVKSRGKILALTSSKGGTGKSHLAVALSAAMASGDHRVLLIDADLGNSMISDRLGFYPRFSVVHFFLKEKNLEDLVEKTPHGFFLIGGERGNMALANLNYFQRMKFLRNFVRISRDFDYVIVDLASGISRQVVDFALLAEKTIIVASPSDLMSAYGSVRACFSRFVQVERRLSERIEGYEPRRVFAPLIVMNHIEDFHQGKTAFEALDGAVENRLQRSDFFRIRLDYGGAVLHDPAIFQKSEAKRCPLGVASVCSRVAFCVDSMANALTTAASVGSMDTEQYLKYAMQVLVNQQNKIRKGLTRRMPRIYPVRIPFRRQGEPISPSI